MNTNSRATTALPQVDIELPLVAQAGSADPLQILGDDGVWGACPYAETDLAPLDDRLAYGAGRRVPSMGDVAAHPARLRMGSSGQADDGRRFLSASRAIRTGSVGLGELAACGQ